MPHQNGPVSTFVAAFFRSILGAIGGVTHPVNPTAKTVAALHVRNPANLHKIRLFSRRQSPGLRSCWGSLR
jgi:hypothetical protein